MWIRDHESEVYQNTYKMLLAKDYIICRLTGKFVTDYSEASGTDAFDLKGMEWSEEVLSAAGIPADKMPELHASTDVIGNLLAHAAEELGLSVNTKVVCGGETDHVLHWEPEVRRMGRCSCRMAPRHGSQELQMKYSWTKTAH
mgnify:CR=1 FL=1